MILALRRVYWAEGGVYGAVCPPFLMVRRIKNTGALYTPIRIEV